LARTFKFALAGGTDTSNTFAIKNFST